MSDVTPVVPAPVEFSWRIAIWKGVKAVAFFIGAAWVALYPIIEEKFADEGTLASLLPPAYVQYAGVLAGVIRVYRSFRKHGQAG